jgi:phenylalanyl-tRNA synthetase beta chain
VLKQELFEAIGRSFTDEEFEDLCFQYGVELEIGDATEMQMNRTDDNGVAVDISKEIVYKIEVAANRYDLLCLEGISQAFRAYLGLGQAPRYTIKNHTPKLHQIIVKPETAAVRPHVVGCVLRNITFDLKSYNSFIDLQDKLHQNICRRRTLASMGTHDLDKFASDSPITYEALPPEEIVFQALKQSESMDANKLFSVFKNDVKMKKFLPILEGHDRYPVFYDKNRQVLSLPPIINSEATKITLNTKNVFIEITGTDLMKTKICLAILAAQFSEYCGPDSKHTIE